MKFILFLFIFFITSKSNSQVFEETNKLEIDTLNPPVIELQPPLIKANKDGKYITREVIVLNKGGSQLKINKIEASCYCGTSKILNGIVEPMSLGKISFTANMDGILNKGKNKLEFYIESNAKNSPLTFIMEIFAADSIEIKKEDK